MPKRKPPMTVAQVAKLGPGNHRVGGVPGLVLQVNKTGDGRSFTVRYTAPDGRRREVGLGSAHIITLQQARDRALEVQQRLRLEGEDPIAAREARRLAALASMSFADAVTSYLKSREGTWGDKHATQWQTTLDTYALPVLGKLPVETIAPAHVAEALRPIWLAKHQTAIRTRQRIEAVIDYADTLARRERPNPARLGGNLELLLPRIEHVAEHHAALDWREAPAFMQRLRRTEGTSARVLEFLIYTAARSGEARGARWDEMVGETWVIPASRMKAGKEHRVPLSTQTQALLARQLRRQELVFPGQRKGPMTDATLAAVPRRLGVDATVHGFRSTFRSWCADHGHPRELAEAALAHAVGDAVEAAYNRTTMLERRRRLMQDWADFLSV